MITHYSNGLMEPFNKKIIKKKLKLPKLKMNDKLNDL
jgi:hypothetical protein